MNFNKVFRNAENVVFTRISPNEIENFKGNFISVINGKAIAVCNGEEIPMPSVLYNEIGVDYHFVDYAEHGLKMAKKHGVYKARKQEPIRVWWNVKAGDPIQTVIDGYLEHEIKLSEGCVAVQNVVKNEFYAINIQTLKEKYQESHDEFDYELWVPKSDAVSDWVYSDVNTYGVLWDGLEFLTTPMINITNINDVYGCNYIVWWGNDGRLSSYVVLGYFRACGQKFYPQPMGEPIKNVESSFNPPKAIIA